MTKMEAKIYRLGEFPYYDSAYEGIATESRDKLYFALCTHNKKCSAGVFSFDFQSKEIESVFSVDEILDQPLSFDSLPHGKIHTKLFMGTDGNLYFGTHFAYPDCVPQAVNYEGGRIIAYNPVSQKVDDHGVLVKGEGIVTMILDQSSMHCYVLTSPSFYFVDYDLMERKICYTSQISKNESSICRSLGLDSDGNVYGSCEPFLVFKYTRKDRHISFLETNFESVSEKNVEWDSPNKKGANKVGRSLWRCIEFDNFSNTFYGINASDSKVFEFDKASYTFSTIEKQSNPETERIYPTLAFAKQGSSYYYCAANGRFDYKLSEDIQSTSSLISFDSKSKKLKEHGLIYGPNGETIYGSASAMCRGDKLYLIGAVSTGRESGINILEFERNQFELALIEIDVSKL